MARMKPCTGTCPVSISCAHKLANSRATELGFARDTLLWSLGLDNVAEVLGGVNWFFILMTIILAGMAIHDFRLHRDKRPDRKIRVMGFGMVIVLTVVVTVVPLCSIHENLSEARSVWVEDLLQSRGQASGQARSAITASIREVTQLRDWPISAAGSLVTVVGQILMLIGSAALERVLSTRDVPSVRSKTHNQS